MRLNRSVSESLKKMVSGRSDRAVIGQLGNRVQGLEVPVPDIAG